MEEALIARLRGAVALRALIADRADWYDRPRVDDDRGEAVVPAITMTMVDPGREWTHGGPDGLDEPRVRFECWAERKDTVTALKRALLAEMEQPRIVAGWQFHEAALETERTDKPDDGPGDMFRVTMDFTFFHQPEEA